jgi:hypothetical protein
MTGRTISGMSLGSESIMISSDQLNVLQHI